MRRYWLKCPVCGKDFTSSVMRTYCSKECNLSARQERNRKLAEKRKQERNEKREKQGGMLDKNAFEARKRHTSYGKIVAEQYLQALGRGADGRTEKPSRILQENRFYFF